MLSRFPATKKKVSWLATVVVTRVLPNNTTVLQQRLEERSLPSVFRKIPSDCSDTLRNEHRSQPSTAPVEATVNLVAFQNFAPVLVQALCSHSSL